MKIFIRIAIAMGLCVAAGVAAFFVYFDAVAGAAIRSGVSEALGVETDVGWVRILFVRGEFHTGSVRIANPAGFETPHFIRMKSGEFDVSIGSLTEDVIEVPSLELAGLDVYLETANGNTNYASILHNLDAFKRRVAGAPKTAAGDGEGVDLVIRELWIRDITAHIDSGKLAGAADRVDVVIPELKLSNVGTGRAGAATVAQVSDTVVRAVLIAVAKRAPSQLVRGLAGSVGSLGSVMLEIPGAGGAESIADKVGRGAGKALKKLGGVFKRE